MEGVSILRKKESLVVLHFLGYWSLDGFWGGAREGFGWGIQASMHTLSDVLRLLTVRKRERDRRERERERERERV